MQKFYLFLFCFAMIGICPALAQRDSSSRQDDSLLNVRLDQQSARVKRLAEERMADSLKRIELENRVATLANTDNLKKQELLEQLKKLRGKDSIKLTRRKHEVDSLRKIVKGFPVVLGQDTLLFIYARQGSFTAQDRAAAISARLKKLAENNDYRSDSLKLAQTEISTDVSYAGTLLISVSEQDALWQNNNRTAYASGLKNLLNQAIVKYRKDNSWQTLLIEAVLALAVILVAGLLIFGINRLFARAYKKMETQKEAFFTGLKVRNYEVFNAEQQLKIIAAALTLFKWLVILLVLYLALPVLFGIFPFTRDLSTQLLAYILTPLKHIGMAVWHYIPNLITIIVILVVFRYVIRLLRFIKTEVERGQLHIPGFYADWANPTYQIIRVLILAFMLIVIFPFLPGSESPIFKGVSVFMGVLFTFGSAGALGNVVAGLVLTYMRAFKIGDRVRIGEVTGDVIEKTVLVTRIRTIKNEIISIPNSTVMGSHTTNYSSESQTSGLIINTTVTIGYDVPWRQVHELLLQAAKNTVHIETEPAPFVLQTSLDDYYVSYNINAYTRQPNKQAVIYSNLHSNIQDYFNQAGVEIMSPHYRAVRDGNTVTVPSQYLPPDYKAPGFIFAPKPANNPENPSPPDAN